MGLSLLHAQSVSYPDCLNVLRTTTQMLCENIDEFDSGDPENSYSIQIEDANSKEEHSGRIKPCGADHEAIRAVSLTERSS